MVKPMKETGRGTKIFYGLLAIIVVLLIMTALMVRSHPMSINERVKTMRQAEGYHHAMNLYHDRYGRFPVHCTNVTELARVLNGENTNDDNPDRITFFSNKMPLRKRALDGYGFPFELSVDDSGTNFILRSYGSKKYREHRIRNSTAFLHNISALYTQTLAQAEAEARARIQYVHFSGANQLNQVKETNHVHSISQ